MSDKPPAGARPRFVEAPDGRAIPVYEWPGRDEPKAVVQVLHGLAEHPARYARFAGHAAARGYTVVAHAHRGHGEHCEADALGHFADRAGWDAVIGDVARVNETIAGEHGAKPLVVFGHSMGSYVAQSFALRRAGKLQALILSGSTTPRRLEVRLGRLLARLIAWRRGPRAVSPLLQQLSFGAFNKRFEPSRTEFDWLSRDPAEVDRYVADPLCGRPSTAALWADLLGGLLEISAPRALDRLPADLPVLILGGEHDPAGGGRRLARLADAYRGSGLADVHLQVYPEGRHEMLNETNRDEVTDKLLAWLDRVTRGQA